MKAKLLIALLCITATASIATASSVRGFVRPTIGYTKPADSNYDGTVVFGLAGGVTLDEKALHEVSLEILASGWNTDYYVNNHWVAETTTARIPILANYRYYIRPSNSRVSGYVGAGVGMEIVTLDTDMDYYYYDYYGYYRDRGDSDSDVAFAAAGTAGISIQVSRMVDIDIGYRGMWQSGCTNTVHSRYGRGYYSDIELGTKSGWVHFITVGASVRF